MLSLVRDCKRVFVLILLFCLSVLVVIKAIVSCTASFGVHTLQWIGTHDFETLLFGFPLDFEPEEKPIAPSFQML